MGAPGHIEPDFLLLTFRIQTVERAVRGEASVIDQQIDGKAQLLGGGEQFLPRFGTQEISREHPP